MSRIKHTAAALLLALPLFSCAGYNAYQKARHAEQTKDWDAAVLAYEKALEIDDDNTSYKIALQRARLEASRVHFEKGKSLKTAMLAVNGGNLQEQVRLAQLALTELEMAVKLDPTNQYAAVELGKVVQVLTDAQRVRDGATIEEMKKRAKLTTKAQPPKLNPASEDPISLSFPRETPVKDIYRALGNAFGINILFDQGVKDDRISIELRDVTAQTALERLMQAANHFYKVLDEKTIIVVPDNPQARRDYEDLVIRTFYLSNGDAEQVTNVVRTMIEARNVFPLKALNAITIRDTADKVQIAEKIIEANDKAKAEVVVDVELIQLDLNKARDVGMAIGGFSASSPGQVFVGSTGADGKPVTITGGAATLDQIRNITSGAVSFSIPTVTYALLKSIGNSELMANPELRISEGEKATLHIGQRIPVPVSTFSSINTGSAGGAYSPVTSYQYQDVGIKVSMEPRVHHNREVTLKLTVEVSNQGAPVEVQGQPPQPTFATRTIESTIRLKDGETNFLAGLIQRNQEESESRTPFLGDIPFLGRLFTRNHKGETRTDLVLTMTPHIVRIADITDDDLAPMWVGTTNNLSFRGVSPRVESQSGIDPFTSGRADPQFSTSASNPQNLQLSPDGEPGNYIQPAPPAPLLGTPGAGLVAPPGSAPTNVFDRPQGQQPPSPPPPPPNPQVRNQSSTSPSTEGLTAMTAAASVPAQMTTEAAMRIAPRIGPQPINMNLKPGEGKLWSVIGMDLDGLTTTELVFHFDPRALSVTEVVLGNALNVDLKTPPVATINRDTGTIRITSSDGKPLGFRSGGEVAAFRVFGGVTGESFLVMEAPELRNEKGAAVTSAISGGRARVE